MSKFVWSALCLALLPAVARAQPQPEATPPATVTPATAEPPAKPAPPASVADKVKLSGYVQGRYEWHEDAVDGLKADNKPANTSMFLVRRGRLKAAYKDAMSEYMLQIDATGKGVSLKDAEASLIEPWTGLGLKLTAGQFKWPFGYEVLQSSSQREMPERARVIRTLFPGERDRGVRLQGKWQMLSLAAAVVNGNGTEDGIYGANDANRFKDVVGRLGFDAGRVTGGVSGYYGKALATKLGKAATATDPAVPPSFTRRDKTRFGADLQLAVPTGALGTLALKGELVLGEEADKDVRGWYALVRQDLGKELAVFARVDDYDPDVDADDDGTMAVGGGVQWAFAKHARLTAAYEHPVKETADPDDDVLTLQVQAGF